MLSDGHAIVRAFLEYIGEDPEREGLRETPRRVCAAWREWFKGYTSTLDLKSFEDGADGYDALVVETNIPVVSFCEHHVAPIIGVAHVGYIPDHRIVGLSKLVRLVEHFARRLQVQERMTTQIADALMEHLRPLGAGAVLECRHLCLETRGVNRSNVVTTTSCLRGALLKEPDARAEFLGMIKR